MNLHPVMPKSIVQKFCSTGKRTRPIYEYKRVEGWDIPRQVKTGDMDFQEYIQQSKDDVDFITLGKTLVQYRENVAAHFVADGKDISLIDLPRNLREYDVMYSKMKKSFEALPDDVRSLFNNDLQVFADQLKSGSLQGTLDTYEQARAAKIAAATKANEGGAE